MPGFAGYLHVEYLQNDATVAPQVPGPGYPSQTYAARTQTRTWARRGRISMAGMSARPSAPT